MNKAQDFANLGRLPTDTPRDHGVALARWVHQRYGTTQPLLLAERAGVRVHYGRWTPVTFGEFDVNQRTITLNLNAPIPTVEVLAHELGHYFAHEMGIEATRAQHELMAEAFAEALKSRL